MSFFQDLAQCISCQTKLHSKFNRQFNICQKCQSQQNSYFENNKGNQKKQFNAQELKQCGKCTYLNEIDSEYCQVCDFMLEKQDKKNTKRQEKHQKQKKYKIYKRQEQQNYKPNFNNILNPQNHEFKTFKSSIPSQYLHINTKFRLTDENYSRLTPIQIKTLTYFHQKASNDQEMLTKKLQGRMKKLKCSASDLKNLQYYIEHQAPIIIHIHVSKHMKFFIKDTHYRNLFQTKITSGKNSTQWRANKQNNMFCNYYKQAKDFQRVKYGAINFTNDPKGIEILKGYGDSYMLLKKNVRQRCTVIDNSSQMKDKNIATLRYTYGIVNTMSNGQLLGALKASRGLEELSNITKFIKEIQIHGPVEFAKDVERLYLSKKQLQKNQVLTNLVEQFCEKNDVDYDLI